MEALKKLQSATFFTKSDFRPIGPMPGILQSISWSPPTRRMFLTFVPTLTTADEPLTFKSLITMTVSPSLSSVPLASRMVFSPLSPVSLPAVHSWPHSGQLYRFRSSYVYEDWHWGQGGNSLMVLISF